MDGIIAKITKIKAPRYFPNIRLMIDKGLVSKSSMVPSFFSSEKLFMVMAGIKKIKIHGAILKNGFMFAKPLSKMLYSPVKTNKNKPLTTKNIPITRYPIGVAKKDCISLFKIANKNV